VLSRLSEFDFVAFTSRNGVRYFFRFLREMGFDARALGGIRVVAIGAATAQALERCGVMPDFVPESFTSEGLFAGLRSRMKVKGKVFLLPRADIAPPDLRLRLEKEGARVEEVETYRTVPESIGSEAREELHRGVDAAAFLSSSSVDSLFRSGIADIATEVLGKAVVVSIGPVTSRTLRERGLQPLEAAEHTSGGVVRALVEAFGEKG
jgi:uroporphyrinogen III methyltransferase/synthase